MKRALRLCSFAVVVGAILLLIVSVFFQSESRSRARDGTSGRLIIEPEGTYLEVSCSGYRIGFESVFYNEYEFTSGLAARRQLCPISNSRTGNWRISEDISTGTDTVRLTAALEASSYEISRDWPVPPSLIVYCWDLTDAQPGKLHIGLSHYGEPHDFSGMVRVSQSFNDSPRRTLKWNASQLDAAAIFMPGDKRDSFLSQLQETDDDSGYELDISIKERQGGRISFDLSGWDKAVRPLLEECGAAL